MIDKIVSIDNAKILASDKAALASMCNYFIEYTSNPISNEDVIKRISDAEIVIVNKYKLSGEIINKLSKTSLICIFGSGFDFIDIETAHKKGITVTNIPDYCTQATAEHAIGLMIAASRYYHKAGLEIRSGIWNPHIYKGLELHKATLGIIGYGKIGRTIAKIAATGFQMNVIKTNSKSRRDELETLLEKSDYISVNVPLNKNTKDLISAKEFDLMKKGVVLVNTSRGAVINEKALIENIKTKKVFSAGLDVFTEEPILSNNPLLEIDNIILTPHIGFKTYSSEKSISRLLVENINSFITREPFNTI
jgi:lactate dehydrogenase-like 2-hydroxyacid dehydrogenase